MLVDPGVCIFCGAPLFFWFPPKNHPLGFPHFISSTSSRRFKTKSWICRKKSMKGKSTPLGGHGWDLMMFIFPTFWGNKMCIFPEIFNKICGNVPLKIEVIARWFKPWPFCLPVGGDDCSLYERVTFSPSQKAHGLNHPGGQWTVSSRKEISRGKKYIWFVDSLGWFLCWSDVFLVLGWFWATWWEVLHLNLSGILKLPGDQEG